MRENRNSMRYAGA